MQDCLTHIMKYLYLHIYIIHIRLYREMFKGPIGDYIAHKYPRAIGFFLLGFPMTGAHVGIGVHPTIPWNVMHFLCGFGNPRPSRCYIYAPCVSAERPSGIWHACHVPWQGISWGRIFQVFHGGFHGDLYSEFWVLYIVQYIDIYGDLYGRIPLGPWLWWSWLRWVNEYDLSRILGCSLSEEWEGYVGGLLQDIHGLEWK